MLDRGEQPAGVSGLLVTRDLLFSTKVTGTANAVGCRVVVTGDVERATELCRAESPRCILLDLGLPDLEIDTVVYRLRAASEDAPVIAYGSHVDRQRLDAASRAGCSEVMPRSKFSGTLPALLRRYLTSDA
jgi:DNA-binding response OmpR family regulator